MSAAMAGAGWAAAFGAAAMAVTARRELERRGRLVARACHELRGPLTAAGLGLHAPGAPGLRFARIEAELVRAARAVDDLQQARSGAPPAVRSDWIEVSGVLRSALAAAAPLAHRHGARLSPVAGGPPAAWVQGDRDRL
jgi:signal transduction histidine kinase